VQIALFDRSDTVNIVQRSPFTSNLSPLTVRLRPFEEVQSGDASPTLDWVSHGGHGDTEDLPFDPSSSRLREHRALRARLFLVLR
jgi:hypothetical protein